MPHRDTSPPFISPPLLIILFPIIILILLFLTVPPLLSATSHILRPTSVVKNSWDSLNILLVVLAILFGVFAKPNNDDNTSPLPRQDENINDTVQRNKVNNNNNNNTSSFEGEGGGYVSNQWFEFSEEKNLPIRSPATGVSRLRRTSSSYPDLRSLETGDDRYKFRFFDDFEIDKFRSTPARDEVNAVVDHRKRWPEAEELQEDRDSYKFRFINDFEVDKFGSTPVRDQVPAVVDHRKRWPEAEEFREVRDSYKFRFINDFEVDKFRSMPVRAAKDQVPAVVDHRNRLPEDNEFQQDRVKLIPVDTFEVQSSSTTPPPQQTSPAPPAPPPPPPPEQTPRRPRRTHQKLESSSEITEAEITRINQTPAPPPPPSVKTRSEHKRRKSNVKREIAMVWASVLSNQRKRKKKQTTKRDNVNELTRNTTAPPPPPPPPPPTPPHSVFQSLFRKGLGKNKKIHSVPTPPPPPPPPLTSSRRWSKRKSQIPSQSAPPPPPPPEGPFRRRNSGRPPLPNKVFNYNYETLNNSGNQSPMIPVPPPPPPFKMPAMKFSIRGDFVKIRSNQSSLCSSPEREDIDESTAFENDGVPIFCPSPDVDVKAATFIAEHKGKWKLEKINSMKVKKNNANGP
ncbi:PREDICTED: bromodomain-containing protein 4-like isoform X2 [Lupinus angustifolius]|uniref:bromodomain-containing protein 4-like isoform X2 n=1 Tax=Lupinus angustifolius TaxID=3871 RepID=UPI00092EE8EA|nr:PREDICTED: bromodomain-containing protein 4-like isoform X2 [Lupinus angustifolius]